MNITVRFTKEKSEWIEWLYYLAFGIGILIAVPFLALMIITNICFFIAKMWLEWLSKILDIQIWI